MSPILHRIEQNLRRIDSILRCIFGKFQAFCPKRKRIKTNNQLQINKLRRL
jgi:hypothetical protein